MGSKAWGIILLTVITLFSITSFEAYHQEMKNLDEISRLKDNLKKTEAVLTEVFQEKFEIERLRVDEVTVSSYSSDINQCDRNPHETSSGLNVSPNCAALSRDLPIAKHKHILAVGLGTIRNEDTMAASKTKQVDLWMPDKTAAQHFGIKKSVKIMWLDNAK